MSFEVTERDSTGELVATYISSAPCGARVGEGKRRVDVVRPERKGNVWAWVLGVFLPVGYPHSVTEDYMWYAMGCALRSDILD